MKIDAHQHFWKYDSQRDSWITDDMAAIRKDFLPADLKPVLQENGINACVTVQSSQSYEENVFQLNNAAENDFIKGVVGWIDFNDAHLEQRLEELSLNRKLKGFRHILQGESQRDIMLEPFFTKGISLLAQFNFTYDILIFADQLPYAAQLAGRFPKQKFMLDHIAKPPIKNHSINEWKKNIETLAKHANVYCKISGMVTEAHWKNWKQDDFKPYIDAVVNAFGTGRVMFGSDWPVCLVAAETYTKMKNIVDGYFAAFTQKEQQLFYGENAQRFYNL
jgi:Predicted metal-dependent hydrolase of the TIM-barrel fold